MHTSRARPGAPRITHPSRLCAATRRRSARYAIAAALLWTLGGCNDVLGIGVVVPVPAPATQDAGAGDGAVPVATCEAIQCDDQARCVDPTSATPCQCDFGFQGDGFSCADIDECAATSHDCDPDATCANTPGSFTCACNPGHIGDGTTCALPASCRALLAADPSAATGVYTLDPDADGPIAAFDALCDMAADGGGWTLIASVVNDRTRRWNSLEVWTDASTFGAIAERTARDFKSPGFARVTGTDLLIRTGDYAFGFRGLVPGSDLAGFIAEGFPDRCNSTYERSAPDYREGLTDEQASVLGFLIRPLDNNATCFPGTNENALIGLNIASCCWAGGLGNTPGGSAGWRGFDLSLLTRDRLVPEPCTAGEYPCNDNGVHINANRFCQDTACMTPYAEVYVR